MPRQSRLDGPGTLHHVMGRGIEKIKIFRNKNDREDFIKRIEKLCANGSWIFLCLGHLIKPFSPFNENRQAALVQEYEESSYRICDQFQLIPCCLQRGSSFLLAYCLII
jgi:hypothetical protein